MYEDSYKNEILSKLEELRTYLDILADLNVDIQLFAMGGTAMVLANVKESTKDIDFMAKDIVKLRKYMQEAGFELKQKGGLDIWNYENTRIDIFQQGYVLGVDLLEDWSEKSELIFKIGKVQIYILNWEDICITKIIRCETRDLDDVKEIIQKQQIDVKELEKRYNKTCEQSIVSKEKEKWEAVLHVIS